MKYRSRVEKLEVDLNLSEPGGDKVELVVPWPDGEPIREMVSPRQRESMMGDIGKIYGTRRKLSE